MITTADVFIIESLDPDDEGNGRFEGVFLGQMLRLHGKAPMYRYVHNRPVVHSDCGGHYRWPGWLSRMQSAKLIRSMSRKGCSPDNAACEGFFGRLKTELFYPRNWQATTIEQFIEVVDAYIRWYNEKRIKISLGSLSPLEYRESLGLTA